VWDRLIIEEAQLEDEEFADALDGDLTQQQITSLQQGNLRQWALQAHRAARDFSYRLPADNDLDDDYYERNAPVVDRQLLRAGLRLASVLDWIFSPPASNSGNPNN
jgi:nuclease S1